jgi:hypothetical protein
MTSQQQAFQNAFLLICQGKQAKLFREGGEWVCVELISKLKLEIVK